jgi:ABC-type branched-subunit amino acid transport system ATPase component
VPIHALRPDKIAQLGINRTYQNIRLFANMSAIENLLVGQHFHLPGTWMGTVLKTRAVRRAEEQAHQEALRLLRYIGLQGRGDWLAKNLPYGDQRRLEIARALASYPELLILDEPAAGMNHVEAAELAELIGSLAEDGVTVLLIEHNVKMVLDTCTRVVVMNFGEVIASGTPAEIRDDSRVIEVADIVCDAKFLLGRLQFGRPLRPTLSKCCSDCPGRSFS